MLREEADRIYEEEVSKALSSGNPYAAVPCPCGAKVCKDWGIYPICSGEAMGFTETEARIAVQALNRAKKEGLIEK